MFSVVASFIPILYRLHHNEHKKNRYFISFFMTQSDNICYDTKNFSHEVLKMKRCISNILMILLFTYSVMPAISTEVDISAQAVLDALRDAEADINKNQ